MMNKHQSLLFGQTLNSPQGSAVATDSERALTMATMIGSVVGAVLMTVYCRTFLESNVAMAMGMIGAVGGALLATLIAPATIPTLAAISKRHGNGNRS